MTVHQYFAGALASLALIFTAIFPDRISPAVACVALSLLYAFTLFVERQEDARIAKFDRRIRDLDEKVQTLMVGRGMGR